MKKYGKNIILLVLISLFIMYLIMKDNFSEIIGYLISAKIEFLLLSLLFIVLYILFQSLSMHLYLKEINKNYKLRDTFILMFSAQFFNGITPFSSGGQPFQMYLLKKQGIKLTESGNALLQNFFVYQLSLIILGTFAVLTNKYFNIIPQTSLLRKIVMIGYLVNILILLLILFLGKAKNINTKVFNKVFNLIFKFMKNRENLKEKAIEKIDEFYNSSEYFKNNKLIFIESLIFNLAALFSLYLIPVFIFYSMGEFNNLELLDSIVCSGYTFFVGSFVPIPGGTGGLEYGFLEFFKGFTVPNMLSACMILWRFITYYLPMILGAFSLIFIRKEENK